MSEKESIVRKIQGLLALAGDGNPNEAESKTAMLQARRLMMKHNIEMSEVEKEFNKQKDVVTKIRWFTRALKLWEKHLAMAIAKNFRCQMYYYGSKGLAFYGFQEDTEMATEVFNFALNVMDFHAKEHVEIYYIKSREEKDRATTKRVKESYYFGFAQGVKDMFKKQTEEMKQEYGLVVLELVPVEVKEAYNELSKEFVRSRASQNSTRYNMDSNSFNSGRERGSKLNVNQGRIGH